jgi:hypothetical protein
MARLYISGDEAKITLKEQYRVDVEFYNGVKFEDLEPRRLFPISGLRKYITLLDNDGNEKCIIRDLDTLMPESREAVEKCLDEYYLVPKIIRIIDTEEKYGILKMKCETERGIRTFDVRNRYSDIKVLYDNRVLIRDSDDNRYEIPDHTRLDKHSKKLLYAEL